jgi:hypothetical protein
LKIEHSLDEATRPLRVIAPFIFVLFRGSCAFLTQWYDPRHHTRKRTKDKEHERISCANLISRGKESSMSKLRVGILGATGMVGQFYPAVGIASAI